MEEQALDNRSATLAPQLHNLYTSCAAGILPPSEPTIAILQSYRNQLDSRIASGHLTRAQARDLLYAKLVEIQPPLPNLGDLMEFRKQVEAQMEAKVLTPEQAEAKLAAHESEMMTRWEEMAAKYPIVEPRNGGAYGTDRAIDGAVVKP